MLPTLRTLELSLQPRHRFWTSVEVPEHPPPARPSAATESAPAAFLDALDDSGKPTARPYLQKAAEAAEQLWQQTVQGYNGPTVTNPTVPEI